MAEVMIPLAELERIAALLARGAAELRETEARLGRQLTVLLPPEVLARLESALPLERTRAAALQAAEQTEALQRVARLIRTAFDELDLRGAASVPVLPRPVFPTADFTPGPAAGAAPPATSAALLPTLRLPMPSANADATDPTI
jgi:hypothetical protein